MLGSIATLMQRLSALLGSENVTAEPGDLDLCRIDGLSPCLVVAPATTGQLAAAVRICSEAQATMIPWGGGTALALGNPPRRAEVVIRLHRLDRVVEHDSPNLTVCVQSGISLSALGSAIAAQNQCVPIDAPLPLKSTVGGVVAANLNGPRRGYYGSVRDLVVGMKVVLANGEQIKAGGKVVKNVAGYDMCKLFIGSLGTLGIITEVTLRVAPVAERTATLVCGGDLGQLEEFHRKLLGSVLSPAALFVVRDGALGPWRFAIRCDGFSASVDRQLRELDQMAARSGLQKEILRDAQQDALWEPLRDFPLVTGGLIYRVTVPRAEVFDYIRLAERWHDMTIVGDMAIGTVWLACAADRRGVERFSSLSATARQRRGHAVLFAAPPLLKTGISVWGPSPPSFSLMSTIKQQFDPHGLLNPGRFIGNL